MSQLVPGAQLFNGGVPVQLLYKLRGTVVEQWLCKLLFVEPIEVVKNFNPRVTYTGLHSKRS